MGRPKKDQPSYLLHKPSGQARVRINGLDHYLGPHGSKESWNNYYQLLADHTGATATIAKAKPAGERFTIAELIVAYSKFAKEYYGERSEQLYRVAAAVRTLDAIYGESPVDEFSPLKLQRVLEQRAAVGDCRKPVKDKRFKTLSRSYVNDLLKTIKRIFKWGVSQELVPNEVYQALATVEGARKGRGKIAAQTHEPRKVLPVPPADVEKTITAAGPEIGAMIRVQLLCGMRPDEVTIMRPCDIEQPKKGCWTYRPTAHKTAWQGHDKEILIGPKAQKILKPFINECASPTDFLFSPRRVTERWIEQKLREAGKEPNLVRLREKKPPRECYDDQSYAQAVRRACRRAKVDEWTPNRLRHNAGTTIRAQFGAEAAKLVLGHRHLSTTEIYAEKDREKYEQIIRKCG